MKQIILILITALFISGCATRKSYESAIKLNSIPGWENFIKEHPRSKYIENAQKELYNLRDDNAWQAAEKKNTMVAYKDYKSAFTKGKYIEEAQKAIDILQEAQDWESAIKDNTISTFNSFTKKYPHSSHLALAREKIDRLTEEKNWNNAVEANDLLLLKEFLMDYPQSAHAAEAKDKIFELEVIKPEWEKVQKLNKLDSLRTFIARYPKSVFASDAGEMIEKIEEKDWDTARSENNYKAYADFYALHPNGKYALEVEKILIDMEVDDIFKGEHGKMPQMQKMSDFSEYENSAYIEVYNNTSYVLTVWYSGAQSHKIVLDPKKKTQFTLEKGKYRVAASVSAANVQNYAGTMNLTVGEYSSEFYIYTQTHYRYY